MSIEYVLNELLQTLPDTSEAATERVRLALLLLGESYPYKSNEVIRRARVRVLRHDVSEVLQDADAAIFARPVRLVRGSGNVMANRVWCCSYNIAGNRDLWDITYSVPGTQILYSDGRTSDVVHTTYVLHLHVALDVAGVYVTEERVTRWMSTSPRFREEFFREAEQRYADAQRRHDESLERNRTLLSRLQDVDDWLAEWEQLEGEANVAPLRRKLQAIRARLE